MKISFAGQSVPNAGVLVILAAQGAKLGPAAGVIDKKTGGQISRAFKAAGYIGARGKLVDILAPSGLKVARVLVAGLGDPAEFDEKAQIDLGGTIAGWLGSANATEAAIKVEVPEGLKTKTAEMAARIAFGARLRVYRFDRYKTAATDEGARDDDKPLAKLVIQSSSATAARRGFARLDAIADGVCMARDLVNEPANILHPAEFSNRLKAMEKFGLKVTVLRERELKRLGMGSLLSVGAGSEHDAHVVSLEWRGGGAKAPVAFVGKGVTFDTGGISLKPGANMGDMKGDMGGAASVAGLMLALASRKAKVNAVGLVGLVENMPDARALRPGDVVTSMSGQTIEVLNTDAEGRLVLADVLWYAQKTFSPRATIDLATLTGAIVVALGHHHAGLFSNDDTLSAHLIAAGKATGELVWRLPLAEPYDKLIDSKVADMKNIGGRDAGSITAAQFLARFVEDVPWAHLDIAGTAMGSPKTAISRGWTSGYGVRLLDRLVADVYEGR
ncbi:Cytosol aminopeptidase PepA [hydrothermal vent metagenome]|uniref:leucyl aminopeptidase n=1 Tax=hydrothermal vent metagenome TaxID=652676 RepID=A0A3B0SY97_9ZZZZ